MLYIKCFTKFLIIHVHVPQNAHSFFVICGHEDNDSDSRPCSDAIHVSSTYRSCVSLLIPANVVSVPTALLPVLLQGIQAEANVRLSPARRAQDRRSGVLSALRQRRHQVTWRLL